MSTPVLSPLLRWLAEPDPGRGLRVLDADREWRSIGYDELARQTFSVAARLEADGVAAGDVVSLALPSGPTFIASFFATLALGATPSPIAPPLVFQDAVAYRHHVDRVVRLSSPKALVTTAELEPKMRECLADGAAVPVTVVPDQVEGIETGPPLRAGDLAILQFTSGSSGPPKGVVIGRDALESNVEAIRRWLAMGRDDGTATWLPMHHDMGLIGCMITPVVNGSDLWVMQPEDFIRSPSRWLGCFGTGGAHLTAVPNFGLAHVVRRVKPASLEGMDFGAWRTAILGAERIDPAVLTRFCALLETYGFRSGALQPAYGLAEATLAVTGSPVGRGHRDAVVDRRSLVEGQEVSVLDPGDSSPHALGLTGCGMALGDAEVRIVDDGGAAVIDGVLGEIAVASPSLATRYLTEAGEIELPRCPHGMRTGDAGVVIDGELFVIGRLGDSLKQRGRTVFAEDLEAALLPIDLKRSGATVLLGQLDGVDHAVVVAETAPGPWADEVLDILRHHLDGVPVLVCSGRRGAVKRTSSGKPRRRPMWRELTEGTLEVELVTASPGARGL